MTSASRDDAHWLAKAVAMAEQSVADGGGPFAAIVVHQGIEVARARNSVTENCDASAHAEVEALRRAGAAMGSPHLKHCVLYASCEPCPMCLATALWSHIDRIVYAADHSAAQRAGFDDTAIALQLYGQSKPVSPRPGLLQHLPLPEAESPFAAWLAKEDRQHY